MKAPGILILLWLCSLSLTAQERIPVELVETQFRINILAPGVGFEYGLNDQQSLTLDVGLSSIIVTDQADDVDVFIAPFIQGNFRHYYPRKRVKKTLRPNSGNYIALVAGYNFNPTNDNFSDPGSRENAFYFGPAWGIQRNYLSGIHLGLALGPGLGIGEDGAFFTGVGAFEFGFVIGGKGR